MTSSSLDPAFFPRSWSQYETISYGAFCRSACHNANNAFLYKRTEKQLVSLKSALRVLVVLLLLLVIKSTEEPSLPLRQETDAKCPLNIWSSRCATAGLFSRWGRTSFSPGSLKQGSRSAGALQSEPSASPLRCSISSPTCGACTWDKQKVTVVISLSIEWEELNGIKTHFFLNDSWDDKLLLTWRAAPSRCPEERGPCTEPCQGFSSCGGEVLLLLLRRLRGRLCWHLCRRAAFMPLILRRRCLSANRGARSSGQLGLI